MSTRKLFLGLSLSWVAEVIAILAALAGLLYSFGWSYVYYYFSRWKMPFERFDISFETTLQYGRRVIVDQLLQFTVIVLTVIVIVFIYKLFSKSKTIDSRLFILLLLVTIWMYSDYAGHRTAENDFESMRLSNYQNLDLIQIVEDKSPADTNLNLLDRLSTADTCYRVIFWGNDRVWIAKTKDKYSDLQVASIPISGKLMIIHPKKGNC